MLMGVTSWELGALRVPLIMVLDTIETDPATNTPQVDQVSLDSEMQTVLALREYLCGTQSDTSRYEV
jgi:hypothetical protein